LFIIGGSIVLWGVVWLAFAMGQTGGTIGFITFFVGNAITIIGGTTILNKLTRHYAWREPEPDVIYQTRYR
jgi:hypothetical protein